MRGVSQVEPNATVVVTRSGPLGRSLLSLSIASVIASLAKISLAVRNSSSPCSVRIRPRAWRWNSGTVRLSSSALICPLTADWLRLSPSPAWVKLPASATERKTLSLSQSMSAFGAPPACARPRALFGRPGGPGLFVCDELLRLQRGHAAHAGRRDRLAEHLVGDVARGEHAGDVGRRRIRGLLDVALGAHVELALEQLGRRRVADRDEHAVDRQLAQRPALEVAQPPARDPGRIAAAQNLVERAVPYDLDLRIVEQPRLENFFRAQRIAPVHQRDRRGVVGQVQRLLDRGVAAADHHDRAVAEEEAVAGRTGRDAESAELLLRRQTEPSRAGAVAHDHGVAAIDRARIADRGKRPFAQVDVGNDVEDD